VGSVPPGTLTLPLAIDDDKVPSEGEPVVIRLNPSPLDDGCWHTFFWANPGSSLIRDLINGTEPSPPLKEGDFIKVKEGVDAAALQALERRLQEHGGTWDVMVPVIPGGESHTGWVEVLGFAAFRLNLVEATGGDKRIEGITLNNRVTPGVNPGGSNDFGLSSGSPKLAQ
jgi:hypothetical protein